MPKPVLQSLILADHVYEDKLTGKRIIAGVFNRIIRGVRVLRQMGPPMPQVPQQPPAYNPPVPSYAPPAQQPGYAAQNPATHAPQQPANQPPAPAFTPMPTPAPPGSQPGFEAPGPATHAPAGQPAIPETELAPPAPPGSQPGFVAPGPATHGTPQQPGFAAQPPATPLAAPLSHSDMYGQSSQLVQPGQPAAPIPPAHQPPAHQPAAHMAGQLGPPGTPLQPGQRVLEIPPTGLQSGSPFAYLSLTEVRGANNFVLELVNLADESQLFRSDLRVDCPDPLLTVEMTVPLPPISPPQAGIYALQLLHNNEILGSLRIIVEDAVQ